MTDLTTTGPSVTDLQAAYGPALVHDYTTAGFRPPDVTTLEQTAVDVLDFYRRTGTGYIDVGRKLAAIRDKFPHGSWTWYVQERLHMSLDVAAAFISAAAAVDREPRLLDHAENIPLSVMSRLTPSLPAGGLEKIVKIAGSRQVKVSDLGAIRGWESHQPARDLGERVTKKAAGPILLPEIPAEEAAGFCDSYADTFGSDVDVTSERYHLTAAHWEAIERHPVYRSWIISLVDPNSEPDGHFDRWLKRWLVLAFAHVYQAGEGDDDGDE